MPAFSWGSISGRGGPLSRLLPLAAALVSVAAGAQAKKEPARLPPDLEAVFGLAMAAPPEFAASAMLRLNGRIPDRDLRRDLIDMAFRFAAKAQNPVRLIAVPGSEVDTRTASLASALRLKMDALSLQASAIREMLAVDPRHARDLFAQMAKPSVSVAGCEDSLVPELAPYYEALAAVAQSSFDEKERAKGEHYAFARAGLSGVSKVAELAPAANAIAGLDWSREHFEIILGSFTAKLEGVNADSRTFLYYSREIEKAIVALAARARAVGADPKTLAETYRKFLVTQLKAPRCADADQIVGRIASGEHTQLFSEEIRGDQPALTGDEATPEQIEGEMKLDRYWQTESARRIFELCLQLRQSANGMTLPESQRRTPEWARQLTDFLGTLANWRPNEEASDADFYHQKATVYEALLELTPPGDAGDRVIENYVAFLKSASLQQQNAVEWFWHARSTVARVRPGHPEQAAKLLAAFRASGNIVLMLEAMLD